jgi:hypothetical protein
LKILRISLENALMDPMLLDPCRGRHLVVGEPVKRVYLVVGSGDAGQPGPSRPAINVPSTIGAASSLRSNKVSEL